MRTEHRHASDGHNHQADHWVYLDRTWAQRLGVKRSAGIYRVRSRDLLTRLGREDAQAERSSATPR